MGRHPIKDASPRSRRIRRISPTPSVEADRKDERISNRTLIPFARLRLDLVYGDRSDPLR